MNPHLSEHTLISLADRSLPEENALEARTHLAACDACREREHEVAALTGALGALRPDHDVDRARSVASAALAAQPPRNLRAPMWAAASLATAALLFAVLPAGESEHAMPVQSSELTARGAGASAEVNLEVFAVDGGATRLLGPDQPLPAGEVSLSVRLAVLPVDFARTAAVYAKDDHGRVTWLLPTWTDAESAPDCIDLPRTASVLSAPTAVALPPFSDHLEVGLILAGRCRLPELDAALESSRPLPDGARLVRRLDLSR